MSVILALKKSSQSGGWHEPRSLKPAWAVRLCLLKRGGVRWAEERKEGKQEGRKEGREGVRKGGGNGREGKNPNISSAFEWEFRPSDNQFPGLLSKQLLDSKNSHNWRADFNLPSLHNHALRSLHILNYKRKEMATMTSLIKCVLINLGPAHLRRSLRRHQWHSLDSGV